MARGNPISPFYALILVLVELIPAALNLVLGLDRAQTVGKSSTTGGTSSRSSRANRGSSTNASTSGGNSANSGHGSSADAEF